MNFYVYKRGDPTTWPKPDCLVFVYDEAALVKYRDVYMNLCKFDEDGFFIPKQGESWIYDPEQCFYIYIEINNKEICLR